MNLPVVLGGLQVTAYWEWPLVLLAPRPLIDTRANGLLGKDVPAADPPSPGRRRTMRWTRRWMWLAAPTISAGSLWPVPQAATPINMVAGCDSDPAASRIRCVRLLMSNLVDMTELL